jgi:hypothetical protein
VERVTGIGPALSAWETNRSGPLIALSWASDAPLVTVIDPVMPGLMARQWPAALQPGGVRTMGSVAQSPRCPHGHRPHRRSRGLRRRYLWPGRRVDPGAHLDHRWAAAIAGHVCRAQLDLCHLPCRVVTFSILSCTSMAVADWDRAGGRRPGGWARRRLAARPDSRSAHSEPVGADRCCGRYPLLGSRLDRRDVNAASPMRSRYRNRGAQPASHLPVPLAMLRLRRRVIVSGRIQQRVLRGYCPDAMLPPPRSSRRRSGGLRPVGGSFA